MLSLTLNSVNSFEVGTGSAVYRRAASQQLPACEVDGESNPLSRPFAGAAQKRKNVRVVSHLWQED